MGSLRKSLIHEKEFIILCLLAVFLLTVMIAIAALWQTAVIFSSLAVAVGADDVDRNISKGTIQNVATYFNTGATREAGNKLRSAAHNVGNDHHTIYFATMGSGLKALSTKTSEVTTVIESTEYFYGVAFDDVGKKLYWTSSYKMYRSGVDGANVETLVDTMQCTKRVS